MGILKKHQSKGVKGFKNFVRNLVGMNTKKRTEILELTSLEDPVYSLWILKNLYDINILFDLAAGHFPEIYAKFGRKLDIFVKAFHGTNEEEKFLEEILEPTLHAAYKDEVEYSAKEVTPGVTHTARVMILDKIHELQDQDIISDLKWELPSKPILMGITNHPKSGPYEYYYEEGMVALKGSYEDKLREGEWVHYYPGNKIMAHGYYHQDEKCDEWVFYYPSGQKKAEGNYKENLRDGEWTHWDQQGNETKVTYKRGRAVE